MQHADPDQLALLALGESLETDDAEVAAHLQQCAVCRHEVDALRRTVELARETVEYRDDEPRGPEAVWSRISDDLGLTGSSAAGSRPPDDGARWPVDFRTGDSGGGDAGGASAAAAGDVSDVRGAEGADGVDTATASGDRVAQGRHRVGAPVGVGPGWGAEGRLQQSAEDGEVVRLRATNRWVRAAGALVAAVAVGVVGTLVAVRPWDGGAVAPATASSEAILEPIAGGPGGVSGRAVVRQGATGPELDVTAAGLPLQPGYYEVWVFDGDRNMVSVGVLGANSTAALPLPPTLDLRTFHVVDISQERYDGDQTHSTVSVLRGTLTS